MTFNLDALTLCVGMRLYMLLSVLFFGHRVKHPEIQSNAKFDCVKTKVMVPRTNHAAATWHSSRTTGLATALCKASVFDREDTTSLNCPPKKPSCVKRESATTAPAVRMCSAVSLCTALQTHLQCSKRLHREQARKEPQQTAAAAECALAQASSMLSNVTYSGLC